MLEDILPWLMLIGILAGAFSLLIMIGDFLTHHPTHIDVHIHPVRTITELRHIIEVDGEVHIYEETSD